MPTQVAPVYNEPVPSYLKGITVLLDTLMRNFAYPDGVDIHSDTSLQIILVTKIVPMITIIGNTTINDEYCRTCLVPENREARIKMQK